jgi:ABC-type sulfate transport system substrate-binding protein
MKIQARELVRKVYASAPVLPRTVGNPPMASSTRGQGDVLLNYEKRSDSGGEEGLKPTFYDHSFH